MVRVRRGEEGMLRTGCVDGGDTGGDIIEYAYVSLEAIRPELELRACTHGDVALVRGVGQHAEGGVEGVLPHEDDWVAVGVADVPQDAVVIGDTEVCLFGADLLGHDPADGALELREAGVHNVFGVEVRAGHQREECIRCSLAVDMIGEEGPGHDLGWVFGQLG